jgi:DNA invertase Pin-like site-specific DNA recombinase
MTTQVKAGTTELLRAAQYMRMSTEHQQYSIANQAAALALYAAAHEIVIVRSYVDAGKSGVYIKGRYALQELIQTVQAGKADFGCILVYDVSRWGRFQDMDEAGHYEYVCKSAGIYIHYCAEQFANDNTMVSGLVKALKRMMAGEYSRELSVKVFAAQARLAGMGFSQGGRVIYGLRRLLVDSNSHPKQILEPNQRKAIHSDRVIYVAGPAEETQTVRRIFDQFTIDRRTTRHIASELNASLIKTSTGKIWTPYDVIKLIRNPKYTGTCIWAKHSRKLNGPRTTNNREKWVVQEGALAALVCSQQFAAAQSRLVLEQQKYTDKQLLNKLRRLWREKGKLSFRVVNGSRENPKSDMFAARFGRLAKAFDLVGFKPKTDYDEVSKVKERVRCAERRLRDSIIEQFRMIGTDLGGNLHSGILTLNGEIGLAIKVIHYKHIKSKWPRAGWHFSINFPEGVHVRIIGCLDRANQNIHAQYVFPKFAQLEGQYWLNDGAERVFLDACRSDTLQPVLRAVSRCPIELELP